MNRKMRGAAMLAVGIAVLWAVFAAGVVTGGLASGRGGPLRVLAGPAPSDPVPEAAEIGFGVFWEAWNAIQENYYEGPLDPEALREGAIRGLAAATEDPHTRFQNAREAAFSRERMEGRFDGVGIRVTLKDGLPFILQPLPGSPAEKAGVRPNEFVTAVDHVSTEGMSLEEMGNLVRGPRGTQVVLTLRPEDHTETRDVTLVRDVIVVASVTKRRIQGMGYVRISNFGRRTAEELREALADLREPGVRGLVLDLRNNPGGLLDASVTVAAQFLAKGELVLVQESRNAPRTEWKVSEDGADLVTPMAVLVNEGTASAAEIVAGALQAHDRALVMGEETVGKGSVQELHRLSDDSMLRITSGIWITPSGVNLAGEGLIPDMVLPSENGQVGSANDPVLQAALRALAAVDFATEPVGLP